MNEAVKIVHKIAKEKLVPLGFVRIGNTPRYALDCGYYMIYIHYLSRPYGIFYNIYFHFFFERTEDFDGAACKDYYNPLKPDVETVVSDFYEDKKEEFEKSVSHYTDEIIKTVNFFLRYKNNISLLVKDLENEGSPTLYWRYLKYGQLCLLAGEYDKGILYLKKSLENLGEPKENDNSSVKELRITLPKMIEEVFSNRETAQQEMVKVVNRKRMIYSNIKRFSRMHLEKPFLLPNDISCESTF